MHLRLQPPDSLGPLRIGMTRGEAGDALARLRHPEVVSDADEPGLMIFRPTGLMIRVHYGADSTVNAIELGRPYGHDNAETDTVTYLDIDVFALPAAEVASQLRAHTLLVEEDDGASWVAPDLLLSFWRPFAEDADPTDTQGYSFNAVLLARPGYSDGPAM